MAKSENDIKEEYLKKLDPKEFREFKLRGLEENSSNNNYDFCFKCLYDYFSKANFSSSIRLLDLGSGPTVHNVASASAFIPHIVLSEFVEANCEELRCWLKKEPAHMDWTAFISRVALAEGRCDLDVACAEIEARIRKAVKNVVHCDILEDQVVPPEISREPYDVVLSCFTLETAAVSKESYSSILGRIRKLLKPKGKLILVGPIKRLDWDVGNNRFHCLPLEPQDIQQALEDNNYGDVQWRLKDKPDEQLDSFKIYFVTCTKY